MAQLRRCEPIVHQLVPPSRHERWAHAMASWSSFTRTLHGDDELMRIINDTVPHHAAAVQLFRAKIERVDLARYALIFRDGGIYADADQQLVSEARMREAACSRSAAVLPTEIVFEAMRSRRGRRRRLVVGQSLLVSPPHHPFWLALIDFLVARYDPRCYEPLNTGPDAVTAFVNSLCAAASSSSMVRSERSLRARALLGNVSFEDGFGDGRITRHHATGQWRTAASLDHRDQHRRQCPNNYASLSRKGYCAGLARRTYLHGLPPSPPWREEPSAFSFVASVVASCVAFVLAYCLLAAVCKWVVDLCRR